MNLEGFTELSDIQRTAILAVIAERLLPEYVRFVQRELHGSVPIYQRILDAIWNHVSGQQMARDQVSVLYEWFHPYVDDADDRRLGPSYDGWAASITMKAAIMSCANESTQAIDAPIVNRFHQFVPSICFEEIRHVHVWDPRIVSSIRRECRLNNEPIDWEAWLISSSGG